jgi:hypothetical protein
MRPFARRGAVLGAILASFVALALRRRRKKQSLWRLVVAVGAAGQEGLVRVLRVPHDPASAGALLDAAALRSAPMLGLDAEWQPERTSRSRVAVLQLAAADCVYVLQLAHMREVPQQVRPPAAAPIPPPPPTPSTPAGVVPACVGTCCRQCCPMQNKS